MNNGFKQIYDYPAHSIPPTIVHFYRKYDLIQFFAEQILSRKIGKEAFFFEIVSHNIG